MRIPLDRHSAVPLYRQIEEFLRLNILTGSLPPETQLPATRQLAEALGVSRITVKNAYATLESDGLVGGREGSGTFVLPPALPLAEKESGAGQAWPLWQLEAAPDEAAPPPAAAGARHPAPISFTGVGDPREFPVKDFYKALQAVIRRDGIAALEYGDFDGGYAPLRSTIAHILASQGIQTHPDHIVVASGSQQALTLACQVLLQPGDVVLTEAPTYNLALELFQALDLKVAGVPLDAQGMQVDKLEPLLQKYHPRLIYTIPNFQNPSGACLSSARRRQLVALADRYNIPVLEDDFVGDLRYEGRAQPAIKALDPGGRVIYIGTFSKMLMPGLRVGYLVVEGPVLWRLIRHKRVTDLTTSTLLQRTLEVYVTIGRYQAHLRRSCRLYRLRRDAMLAAIRHHLPPGVAVDPPQGGLFVWLRLPQGLSALDLLPLAAAEGVDYAPGSRFFPVAAEGEPYLRLNFATQTPDDIDTGIRRLGAALKRLKGRK